MRPLGRGPKDSTVEIAAIVSIALGIPFIVLAIGCANTANLQLARAAERQAEIAVKRSLGATRGLIVRQMLIESVFVAAMAGALAVLITVWATRLLDGYMPVPCPVDWRVLLFALGVVLMTGIGFGIAPALGSTRGNLTMPLKDSGSTGLHSRSRLRGALVVAQVSLSILLLVMAGLFTRSVRQLQGVGAERDMSHVAAATVDLALLKYTEPRGRAFQEEWLRRIERTPGVVAAAIAPFEPFGLNPGLTYLTDDYTGRLPYLYTHGGAPLGRFVETAGLRVIRGRGFTDEDRVGTPKVALVSEALAKQISPSGAAVGRRVLVADGLKPSNEVTIVGITADAALQSLRADPQAMFLPSPLNYDSHVTLWVRTAGDPALVLPTIRQIVRDLDPQLPIRGIGTGDTWRAREIEPVRWIASGLGVMGLLAVVLAGAGLYAVMSVPGLQPAPRDGGAARARCEACRSLAARRRQRAAPVGSGRSTRCAAGGPGRPRREGHAVRDFSARSDCTRRRRRSPHRRRRHRDPRPRASRRAPRPARHAAAAVNRDPRSVVRSPRSESVVRSPKTLRAVPTIGVEDPVTIWSQRCRPSWLIGTVGPRTADRGPRRTDAIYTWRPGVQGV